MERNINSSLATLRGLAALLVFISHIPINNGANLLWIIGRIGVVIFFAMSGYLAYSSKKKRTAKQYIFNRFIRIYPIYWIILLIGFFTLDISDKSFGNLFWNMTLFQQFVGYDCIIGSSWMLPIQICFFGLIGIFGINWIERKTDYLLIVVLSLSLMTIGFGYLRFSTGKNIPVAFFLLLMVAFLGIGFEQFVNRKIHLKKMVIYILIFEIGLIISSTLSYKDMTICYIIAYNLGILSFVLFYYSKLSFKLFEKLGEVGFTFFLVADIPYVIAGWFVDFNSNVFVFMIGIAYKFIATLVISIIVTRYIEKPLLKLGKRIEAKL